MWRHIFECLFKEFRCASLGLSPHLLHSCWLSRSASQLTVAIITELKDGFRLEPSQMQSTNNRFTRFIIVGILMTS